MSWESWSRKGLQERNKLHGHHESSFIFHFQVPTPLDSVSFLLNPFFCHFYFCTWVSICFLSERTLSSIKNMNKVHVFSKKKLPFFCPSCCCLLDIFSSLFLQHQQYKNHQSHFFLTFPLSTMQKHFLGNRWSSFLSTSPHPCIYPTPIFTII